MIRMKKIVIQWLNYKVGKWLRILTIKLTIFFFFLSFLPNKTLRFINLVFTSFSHPLVSFSSLPYVQYYKKNHLKVIKSLKFIISKPLYYFSLFFL